MTQSKQTYMLFVGSLALILIIGALAAQAQDTAVKKGGTWTAHTVKKPKSQGRLASSRLDCRPYQPFHQGPEAARESDCL